MKRFVLIKAIGAPGSIGFLLAGLVVGVLLLRFARTRRIGRILLTALGATYLALSIPVVANLISGPVTSMPAGPVPALGQDRDVFVLDGDNYQARAKRAAELHAEIAPRMVWILGGTDLRTALVDHGIPVDRLTWGGLPDETTHGQIVQMLTVMRQHDIRAPVLVASRVQARRVAGLARRQGVDIVLIASPLDDEPVSTGVGRWVPSFAALALSRETLYEGVALAYYRWKGWIE